jgi:alkylation response protein AidB-like acyl-CoA dehydrogenase
VLTPAEGREAAIAAAKSYISIAAIKLGEECIQFHGGMGVSDELPIGHAHKRILVLASFLGDADYELVKYNKAVKEAVLF